MTQHIVIIGAGPAGESAAKTLRKIASGKVAAGQAFSPSEIKITLIEKEQPGGLCLNKGCIPSKTLLEKVRESAESGKPVDWNALQEFKNGVVSTIRQQLQTTLKTLKIDVLQGTASFSGPRELEVASAGEKKNLSFDKALIATGTDIFFPPPLDQFKDDLLTSDTLLQLEKTPESIVIVGGGAVGLEFACLLNAAGSRVTVIEMQNGILPGEDPFVVSTLTKSFEARGIKIKTGTKVSTLKNENNTWTVGLESGETLTVDRVAACVGRAANHQPLRPEAAGLELVKGRIRTDHQLRTSNPNVFVCGDAFNTRLAHAAAAQAEVAARNILGESESFDDTLVPRCLYSWPEVASVGKWKYELEGAGKPVKTSRAFFRASAKAMAADETEGFVQIVFNPETDRLEGAQILGPHATELIHVFSVALKAEMTKKDLSSVIFAHPTLSESIKEALLK